MAEEVEAIHKSLSSAEILETESMEPIALSNEEQVALPSLELKELPKHLKYVFLGEGKRHPVIISSKLTQAQEEEVVQVLGRRKKAIGWSIEGIRGISPSMCMHKIILEEGPS